MNVKKSRKSSYLVNSATIKINVFVLKIKTKTNWHTKQTHVVHTENRADNNKK